MGPNEPRSKASYGPNAKLRGVPTPIAAWAALCAVLLCGCTADGLQAINPYTGEVSTFHRSSDLPEGWELCDDPTPGCPGLESCHVLDRASCYVRSDCEVVRCGVQPTWCDRDENGEECDELVACVDAVFTCDVTDCGPVPNIPAFECADGTLAGFTGRCVAEADKTCAWEVLNCPALLP